VTWNRHDPPRKAIEDELTELQNRLKQHEDILQHLLTVPENEALATIRRLKATPDVAAVLSSIKRSPVSRRPSDIQAARAQLQPTHSQIEFELMVCHSNAFKQTMPMHMTTIDLGDIFLRPRTLTPEKLATNSLINSDKASWPETTEVFDDVEPLLVVADVPSPLRGTPDKRPALLSGPLRARVYCDSRLESLDIRYWTKVPISDEFAATLISVYLENEHPIIGAFDPETFLDDIVAQRAEFCSPYLVSSVLCLACVSMLLFSPPLC
jgi:hypothetical protein